MSELPMGWAEATLERLCSFNPRHNPLIERQIEISFVPMPAVCDREGVILPHEPRFLEEVWKGYTHFQNSDVIFAKITPCMENGKIALASGLRNGLACGSTEFHVLRSLGVVLPEYLWRFIRQLDFRKEAERHMTGAVGQRRVPVQFLKETTIPVPPLPEQRRIVAKLDRLFTRSSRAREELEQIPKLIQRYKQAVLEAACSGHLTADWREQNPDVEPASELLNRIYYERLRRHSRSFETATNEGRKKPSKLKPLSLINDDSFDIPASWTLAYPEDIASSDDYSIGIGPFGSNLKVSDYIDSGIPLIFVRHIRTGDFSGQDPKYISLEKANELRPHTIEPLDLLITKMGEPPGDCEIYPLDRPLGVITSDCLKLRVWKDDLVREYFKNCINSPIVTVQLGLITRGVAQQKISVERFKSVIFPVPPLEEQKEIVQRVEKLFKAIDLMEQEYQKASKLCDRLEQATLAKAFRGELVPQNPDDEPASVLLERILAEKPDQPNSKAVKSKKSQSRGIS